MKVLVMGCGGLGGIVTARLLRAGVDVRAVTTNAAIAVTIEREGMRVDGAEPLHVSASEARGRIVVGVPTETRFDVIVLATQPPQVEAAARQSVALLADDGAMICLQNGLCEARVAATAGLARGADSRTLGAVVSWGAAMPSPGRYDHTARGRFTLGTFEGPLDSRAHAIAELLRIAFPVELTDNLAGKRWSKLAINCVISSLGTLAGERLGRVMREVHIRRLGLEVMRECVQVAHAEGIGLEKVSGTLDLPWMAAPGNLVAKHAMLLAVGFGYRKMRSSMLSAIERGRPPAIDFLNGEIVARGRDHAIATPINAALTDAVWSLARGETKPSLAAVEALYRATRA